MRTTRHMSDAHESHVASLMEGRMTKGSGNQWHDTADGKMNPRVLEYAFGWDGKSTFGKSIGVTLEMWEKTRKQTRGLRPAMPLRWYANERGAVGLDLVVITLDDFAALVADANAYRQEHPDG